jgi:putative endonuclease
MTSTTDTPGGARQALGRYGERLAARHLVEQGMVVLDRNWQCDVRTSTSFVHPWEAVTESKADRLRDLSVRWVAEHGVRPDGVRIDLVVWMLPRGRPVLKHVRGMGWARTKFM